VVNADFISNLFNLKGKTALVTGAGQNIGQGIALALGLSGARIAILDKDPVKAKQTVDLCNEYKIDAIALTADVTLPQEFDSALATLIAKWGRLDIAFNNVGLCYGGKAEEMSLSDWQAIMKVNLDSTFYGCQQEFKLMKKNATGKIINIASVAGVLVPHPQKIAAYNTAKAGIIHMTRSLASEWASAGITVNAISPGTIHVPAFEEEGMREWFNSWQQQIPMQRLAKVSDLLGVAIFLAASASDYMTGQNLIIDGGHTLW
jgi:NAD(P)-dependent dehydrogenase (short-subunit alcohol dehydrogenase family)